MKKLVFGAIVALSAALLVPTAAFGNPTLPAPQTWTNTSLQEMLRVSGNISLSVTGSGFGAQTGTIAVEKPANSTVIAAYLTSAITTQNAPSIRLEGQPVTFTHHADGIAGANHFLNHFADVTSLVKTTIDSHAAGTFTLSLDEGTTTGTDGEELVVIFQDPSKDTSSAIIMFGSSLVAGDQFTLNFPALTNLTAQKSSLSLGIGHSYQTSTDRSQYTTVEIKTSSNQTFQQVSNTAGGVDDAVPTIVNGVEYFSSAFITVGGVGDSLDLPDLSNALANDDELYGLNTFLTAGDTSLTLKTANPDNSDSLFQAVFYFEGVALQGAVATQVAPYVAPVNNS